MAEYRRERDIDTVGLTPEQTRARRARNVAIAVSLVALVALFYWSTVAKFGSMLLAGREMPTQVDRSVPDPDFQPQAPKEETSP